MNKLTIFLILGFFFLTSSAEAQEILLNCKWERGKVGKRILIKEDDLAKDIVIGLNIPQKRITKSFYGGEIKIISWSENQITWSAKSEPLKVDINYSLSRISGSLEIVFDDHEDKITIKNYYKCDKTQKKF